ncbi:MAG: hypothetical protein IPO43_12615 [Rhodoferax sp.]|nr:hypothetical protein [Rhodoferax sp.]
MGYLSHPDDFRSSILREGGPGASRYFSWRPQPSRQRVKGDLLNGHCVTDAADWEDAIRSRAGTNHHPVGTCYGGSGADAVVDAQLRVCTACKV